MNGMVRRPRKMPPMPTVSAIVCFRPYLRGILKSSNVAWCMPICTMLMTKSASARQRRRSACSSIRAPALSCSDVQRAIRPAVSSRSASMSCSAMVQPRSSGRFSRSVSRFFTNTTLPAPIIAILVMTAPSTSVRYWRCPAPDNAGMPERWPASVAATTRPGPSHCPSPDLPRHAAGSGRAGR